MVVEALGNRYIRKMQIQKKQHRVIRIKDIHKFFCYFIFNFFHYYPSSNIVKLKYDVFLMQKADQGHSSLFCGLRK